MNDGTWYRILRFAGKLGLLTVSWDLGSRMKTVDWRERIVVDPKILVGKPVIKGTRIAVELIIDLLARGWTKEQVMQQYDHVTADDIRACLAYASEILKSERVYILPA